MLTHRIRKLRNAGMKVIAVVLLSASCALVSSTTSAGTVYRWTDAQGNVVMSDRPPPAGTPYTTLNGRSFGVSNEATKAAAPTTSPPTSHSPTTQSTDREPSAPGENAAPTRSNTTNAVSDRSDELCEKTRKNIANLKTYPKIQVTNPDGTKGYMSDEQRLVELAAEKKRESEYCE